MFNSEWKPYKRKSIVLSFGFIVADSGGILRRETVWFCSLIQWEQQRGQRVCFGLWVHVIDSERDTLERQRYGFVLWLHGIFVIDSVGTPKGAKRIALSLDYMVVCSWGIL